MDTSRKNNDCYFYYYSTCRKGYGCTFRHEPSALGCETTCSYWQQGKCDKLRCNYRHMELRKNRKLIPCYWENQPSGCRKPHCPFLHKNARDPVAVLDRDESAGLPSERAPYDESVANSDVGPRRVSNDANIGNPPIDPLVVNFEEESDSESAPTTTPVKTPTASRRLVVKTLDEIRLERVQAEQAALFSYETEEGPDLRSWLRRQARQERAPSEEPDNNVFVKTLEQIRAEKVATASRKRSHSPIVFDDASPLKKSSTLTLKRTSHPVKLQRNPERWTCRVDSNSPTSNTDDASDQMQERLEHPASGRDATEVNGNCESYAPDEPSVLNGTSAGKLRDSFELEEELLSDSHTDFVNIKADEDILQDIDNLLMD